MRYYVSCVGRRGNVWGFDCDTFSEAEDKADFEVSDGPAVSTEVYDSDDCTVYADCR